jgi:cellulose synthase (UDP-forming)
VKNWLDAYYSLPVAGTVAVILLVLTLVSSWFVTKRRFVLSALLFLCAQYMLWRGLYTLNTDSLVGMVVSGAVYLAELYNLAHIALFVCQAWRLPDRATPSLTTTPTVDIFVPIVQEPLFVLERTLVCCLGLDYPRDRFQVYVLDDGHRDDVKHLAQSLGCHYLRRPRRGEGAKAGNLNYGVAHSTGEFIAVFDTDHVPARSFLRETMPHFEDPTVALVQTAHHFYNRDIFQRNLRLQQTVQDEQRLFFRTIQPGRDGRNSAFFAGSSGVFRRTVLQEVGGFRQETITEDLHTSLLIHAKGYRSCYVNKELSTGLMPETLDGYLSQRMRWATGAIQLFFHSSPLTTPGLTVAQRVDYLGAVHYFLFGLPRLICLMAPLPWLYFGIPALRADGLTLGVYFFSYFLAFQFTIQMVSRGMRSAIWSDIYETMLSFVVTRAVVGALVLPRKPRPFVVTPKGGLRPPAAVLNPLIRPHFFLFVLLVGAMVVGSVRISLHVAPEGTLISMFWAAVNLALLGAAISAAQELPQRQQRVRVPAHLSCALVAGGRRIAGHTIDLSERGALVAVHEPVETSSGSVWLELPRNDEPPVSLCGSVIRQEIGTANTCFVGVQFDEPSDEHRQGLIRLMFSAPQAGWKSDPGPNFGASLLAVIRGILAAYSPLKPSRRRMLRLPCDEAGRLMIQGEHVDVRVRDISYAGISLWVPPLRVEVPEHPVRLELCEITLQIRPQRPLPREGSGVLACAVVNIERGEAEWAQLHRRWWGHQQVMS